MILIPLQAVPAQTLTIQLGDQGVRIDLRQLSTSLFIDVYVNESGTDIPAIQGRIARNLVKIARGRIEGDLFFYDTQGTSDPTYDGLGTRYVLYWDADG